MSTISIYTKKKSTVIELRNVTIVKTERDYDGLQKIYYLLEGSTRPDDLLCIQGSQEDFQFVKIKD